MEDNTVSDSAYAYAVALLDAGIQPYLIPVDGELHVVACKPTDRGSVSQMINQDGDVRDGYMVCAMGNVRKWVDEEAFA